MTVPGHTPGWMFHISHDPPTGRSRRRESAHSSPKSSQRGLTSAAREINDLRELVLDCAAHLLVQTGKAGSPAAARKEAENCLASGAPRKKWDEMLVAQGADLNAFNQKLALDHSAPVMLEIKADRSGYVARCDARIVGEVIRDLGSGRLTKESVINHDVGVDRLAKPGERVKKSAVLCRVHAADREQAATAGARLKTAFKFSTQ